MFGIKYFNCFALDFLFILDIKMTLIYLNAWKILSLHLKIPKDYCLVILFVYLLTIGTTKADATWLYKEHSINLSQSGLLQELQKLILINNLESGMAHSMNSINVAVEDIGNDSFEIVLLLNQPVYAMFWVFWARHNIPLFRLKQD